MFSDTTTVESDFLIASFKRSLMAGNLADRTVETYSESVRQFIDFLLQSGMPTEPTQVTREYVESFVDNRLSKWKPATANNRYRGLQSYFKWLEGEGEVKSSPMFLMKPPRIQNLTLCRVIPTGL